MNVAQLLEVWCESVTAAINCFTLPQKDTYALTVVSTNPTNPQRNNDGPTESPHDAGQVEVLRLSQLGCLQAPGSEEEDGRGNQQANLLPHYEVEEQTGVKRHLQWPSNSQQT